MKKYSVALFLILILGSGIIAQNSYIDSLTTIATKSNNDTSKVDALINLAAKLMHSEPDKADQYATEALSVSKNINYKKGEANANAKLGNIAYVKADFDKALEYFNISFEQAVKIGNLRLQISCINNIGNVYDEKGMADSAIATYNKGLNVNDSATWPLAHAVLTSNIANLYSQQSKYELALEKYYYSLKIAENLNDSSRIAKYTYSIGVVYFELGMPGKALKKYLFAVKIYKNSNNLYKLSTGYNAIAVIYKNTGKTNLAIEYFVKSIELAKTNNKATLPNSYLSLADIYISKNNISEAEKYLDLCYNIASEINDYLVLSSVYLEYGKLFMLKKDYKSAVSNFNKAKETSLQNRALIYYHNSLASLIKCYIHLNMNDSAVASFNEFQTISDSVFSENLGNSLTEMEVKYETELKDAENKNLKTENKLHEQTIVSKNRITYIILLILGLILVIAIILIISRKKLQKANRLLFQQKEEIKTQAKNLNVVNAELNKLNQYKTDMTGMLVHDIKNPLNTIIGHTQIKDFKKSFRQIYGAAHTILNIVSNILDVQKFESSNPSVQINELKLLDLINEAIGRIEILKSEKQIFIENNCSSIYVKADKQLIIRVLVNLLTNAVKFSEIGSKIIINSQVLDNSLVQIEVKDFGSGIEIGKIDDIFDKFSQNEIKSSGIAQSTGLGLAFCKHAIEALTGEIFAKSEKGKGTSFYFSLSGRLYENDNKSEQEISKTKKLTNEDKLCINEFLLVLKEKKIYETTKIKQILKQIDNTSENIIAWKEQLLLACYTSSQDKYNNLLNEI